MTAKEKLLEITGMESIRLKLDGRSQTFKLEEVVGIGISATSNGQLLSEEMAKQPMLYAWWSRLATFARDRREKAERELKQLEHEVSLETRELAEKEKVKTTESMVVSLTQGHHGVVAKRLELEEMRKHERHLGVIRSALEHRKDMLISIGAQLRAEMSADVRIKEER
jgi:hypothetical protein